MAKEQLNVMIDPVLKEKFKKAARTNIGDMHGAVSLAATQAIQEWIQKHEHHKPN